MGNALASVRACVCACVRACVRASQCVRCARCIAACDVVLHRNTDGDATYVFKNAELQSADDVKWLEGGGEGDVLTRFTFDLSQIAQGVAAWDASMAGKSQMYADLDSMRGLQLAVWFSECERAEYQGQETICWRHTGYKSAWLAQDDDPAMPSAYSHEKVNNTEVIFHPNFCLNGPLDDAWYSVEIVELMCFGACSIQTALANQTNMGVHNAGIWL